MIAGGGAVNYAALHAGLLAERAQLDALIAALAPFIAQAPPANGFVAKKGKQAKAAKKITGSRPRITPETIAKIQAMDGQGKRQGDIAAACGVSIPTVKKYANAKSVKVAPSVGKVDPRTGRPWV